MSKSPNIDTVRHKVHRNCWDCDNYGHGGCKCDRSLRRHKKRRSRAFVEAETQYLTVAEIESDDLMLCRHCFEVFTSDTCPSCRWDPSV